MRKSWAYLHQPAQYRAEIAQALLTSGSKSTAWTTAHGVGQEPRLAKHYEGWPGLQVNLQVSIHSTRVSFEKGI